jgi:hypothetical protein
MWVSFLLLDCVLHCSAFENSDPIVLQFVFDAISDDGDELRASSMLPRLSTLLNTASKPAPSKSSIPSNSFTLTERLEEMARRETSRLIYLFWGGKAAGEGLIPGEVLIERALAVSAHVEVSYIVSFILCRRKDIEKRVSYV